MSAADVKPSTYFGAGYALDASAHVMKMNTATAGSNILLKQLTDAQGHATSGNAEQVALAFCEMMYQAYLAQVAANNRPNQMSMQRSGNPTTAGFDMSYTLNFSFTETGTWTVVAES